MRIRTEARGQSFGLLLAGLYHTQPSSFIISIAYAVLHGAIIAPRASVKNFPAYKYRKRFSHQQGNPSAAEFLPRHYRSSTHPRHQQISTH